MPEASNKTMYFHFTLYLLHKHCYQLFQLEPGTSTATLTIDASLSESYKDA